jgi:PAS domain S-box-containing protein
MTTIFMNQNQNTQPIRSLSDENYRRLIEKSLTGIFAYQSDRVLFINPRFTEILLYEAENMVDKFIWEFIYDEDIPAVRKLMEQQKREQWEDLHYQCRLIRADGKLIWADVASSMISADTNDDAVLVNFYDITEQKEAEAKRQEILEIAKRQEEQLVHSSRLAELGEMAAAISHELNQPLTGIRNFARNAYYMLEQNVGSLEEVKTNLRLISEQVDRASKIIKRMRELARRSERQFTPVDINNLIRESVDFLLPQMKLSGVRVRLDLARTLPETIGDRIQLEQVFLNLLTNARQAMEDAPDRELTVRTLFAPRQALPISIEIHDTGTGFAPEDTEKLFRPFFTTKKTGHGTGLGLSISLGIIRDHHGTIEAVGAVSHGATFTIRLPVVQASE